MASCKFFAFTLFFVRLIPNYPLVIIISTIIIVIIKTYVYFLAVHYNKTLN